MEINYIISVVSRDMGGDMVSLCAEHKLPIVLTVLGRGTASKKLLDLYGLESAAKSIIITAANAQKSAAFIAEVKRRFYIDVPGNGIILSIPIKSVGGAMALALLSDNAVPDKTPPKLTFENEMVVAIINEGYTDDVMDAARAAGAMGGTVIHAKGSGTQKAEKFYGVSLVNEKEIVLIVAKASEKADIMRRIIKDAGPGTPVGAVVFSLPVSYAAGLNL